MCLMCGDPFPLELPLGPLLNHNMCRVLADTPYCITLDLYLATEGVCKQKVEVEVSSYHGGPLLHQGLFHGQMLVYSAKRKASLATLRSEPAQINSLYSVLCVLYFLISVLSWSYLLIKFLYQYRTGYQRKYEEEIRCKKQFSESIKSC